MISIIYYIYKQDNNIICKKMSIRQSQTLPRRTLVSLLNRTSSDMMAKNQGKKSYVEDALTLTTSDGSQVTQKEKKTGRFEISGGSGIIKKIR